MQHLSCLTGFGDPPQVPYGEVTTTLKPPSRERVGQDLDRPWKVPLGIRLGWQCLETSVSSPVEWGQSPPASPCENEVMTGQTLVRGAVHKKPLKMGQQLEVPAVLAEGKKAVPNTEMVGHTIPNSSSRGCGALF